MDDDGYTLQYYPGITAIRDKVGNFKPRAGRLPKYKYDIYDNGTLIFNGDAHECADFAGISEAALYKICSCGMNLNRKYQVKRVK